MACKSCGSGGCSKSGSCTSCGTMNVFDWLNDMNEPGQKFDVIEVRFKGGGKGYFRNVNNLNIEIGDSVVIEAQPGHHIGDVTLTGELVRLQLKKKKIEYNEALPIIYRIATQKDLEKFEVARNREISTMYRAREIIRDTNLQMKLSDVEYQADNTKATFFYSAEDRVDFRELIKLLAKEFKIRVEMRQISLRQEASRLGGIGSCGRELCCSTWMSEFKSVSTSAARYQNLSLNPGKLSGQCGRLKCCLNYELDTYIEALEHFPEVEKPLKTERGDAKLFKTDIFKGLMWFGYPDDNNWHAINIQRVKEIIEANKAGKTVYSLESDEEDDEEEVVEAVNNDLDKLDRKFRKKNTPKKKRNNRNKNRNNKSNEQRNQKTPQNKQDNKQGGNKPDRNKQGGNKPEGNKQGGNNKNGNRPPKNKQGQDKGDKQQNQHKNKQGQNKKPNRGNQNRQNVKNDNNKPQNELSKSGQDRPKRQNFKHRKRENPNKSQES